jgi:subtilisin family serine protease
MTPPEDLPADGTPAANRYQTQLSYLERVYAGQVERGPREWARTGVDYLYRKGHVLVRDQYLNDVLTLLRERPLDIAADRGEGRRHSAPDQRLPDRNLNPVLAGVTLVKVEPNHTILNALDLIEGTIGRGIAAPDHLVSICPTGYCPASEPEVVPPWAVPDPPPSKDRTAGEGVRVYVVDTGLDPAAPAGHTWMTGVTGETDDLFTPPPQGQAPIPKIMKYGGHGTFVAGVLRCVAPAADVVVKRVLGTPQAGAAFESDLVVALDHALAEAPDIISMSAGTLTYDATGLLSFEVFGETRLSRLKGVAMVVAAGNNDGTRPFYPAAFDWTVSVGALARNWRDRASFSDHGGWVDVYAPGEDIVNAFPTGDYDCEDPPYAGEHRTFAGMARWSGTSFATPIVAGTIAARMSHTGENGRTAAAAVLAQARSHHQPGVGAVVRPS